MERIIKILETINRRGMDRVIAYLRESNYATARCSSHHKYRGGLVDHSLEVYHLMLERRGTLNKESIAICALLHDLGKSYCANYRPQGSHYERSIAILDRCDFDITADERNAILNHHIISLEYVTNSLRHCLSSSDMSSTGEWKKAHPSKNPLKQLRDNILYAISKW
ncbi:MAG: HDIG domain-containing protein [Alistipes sp.]|nr:HDIG domain-containing protein [Alistipes sp.]